MNKVLTFIFSVLLLAIILGCVLFSGMIYDMGSHSKVSGYFLERSSNAGYDSRYWLNIKPSSDFSEEDLRRMLLRKYVREYFYVVPDVENAEARKNCKNLDGSTYAFCGMSGGLTSNAFTQWLNDEYPTIKKMSELKYLRVVNIPMRGISVDKHTSMYRVAYELITYKDPNDLFKEPEIENGVLLIDVAPREIEVDSTDKKQQELEEGKDAASVFSGFVVKSVLKRNDL